jgi:hypothetical protein
MLLAAILLVFSAPQNGDILKATNDSPARISSVSAEDSSLSESLPSAPEPKVKTDEDTLTGTGAEKSNNSTAVDSAPMAGGIAPGAASTIEPATPAATPISIAPMKPFAGRSSETATQRKLWYALSFTGSGAAAFDAWSTRRAISQGYGVEANPMLKPFAHSGMLYAATQVSPLVMDYLGKRMMGSQHRLLRKMWWLPQAAGSSVSLFAGVHNTRLVP